MATAIRNSSELLFAAGCSHGACEHFTMTMNAYAELLLLAEREHVVPVIRTDS